MINIESENSAELQSLLERRADIIAQLAAIDGREESKEVNDNAGAKDTNTTESVLNDSDLEKPIPVTEEPTNAVEGATKISLSDYEIGATAASEASSCRATSPSKRSESPKQSVYHVKWVKFKGQDVGIVTQNENGPCPLLAIMNVLLLQQRVQFPASLQMVTSQQLLDYLANTIFEHSPKVSFNYLWG